MKRIALFVALFSPAGIPAAQANSNCAEAAAALSGAAAALAQASLNETAAAADAGVKNETGTGANIGQSGASCATEWQNAANQYEAIAKQAQSALKKLSSSEACKSYDDPKEKIEASSGTLTQKHIEEAQKAIDQASTASDAAKNDSSKAEDAKAAVKEAKQKIAVVAGHARSGKAAALNGVQDCRAKDRLGKSTGGEKAAKDKKQGGGGMGQMAGALPALASALKPLLDKKPKEAKKEDFEALATAAGVCEAFSPADTTAITAAQCEDNPAFTKDMAPRRISNAGSCKCMCTGMQGSNFVCEAQKTAGIPDMSSSSNALTISNWTENAVTDQGGEATIPENKESALRTLGRGGDYGLPSGWGSDEESTDGATETNTVASTGGGPTSMGSTRALSAVSNTRSPAELDCKLERNKDVAECRRLRAIDEDKLLK